MSRCIHHSVTRLLYGYDCTSTQRSSHSYWAAKAAVISYVAVTGARGAAAVIVME